MKLGKAEPLCMFDHHHGRFGNVDADFNNRRCYQQAALSAGEPRHSGILVDRFEAAVNQVDRVFTEPLFENNAALLCCGKVGLLGFFNLWTDPINSFAPRQRPADRRDKIFKALERDHARVYRLPTGWFLTQFGNVHVTEIGESQRARDRGRRHHEHVDRVTFLGQRKPLMNAKSMLFIDDCQPKILERNLFLEQRVRSCEQIEVAGGKPIEKLRPLTATFSTREEANANTGSLPQGREGREVLPSQNLGRRHQCDLTARVDDLGGSQESDDRLAGADVTLQQAQHALRLAEVGHNLLDGAAL
jgi:hypothetical protein